ncbi:TPA: hypothetical protein VJE68_000058 [Streptococcus pyogenes]|nr:hypothetical protein [Streptococcus pyogenes]HER0886571.1 hypothetical protein [Streptococcus pyogenes]HER0889987.1 hypothetical protein [Streptococcus pyogenes]HER0893354.1 hypothetical protein [Streptococcus pyogenes]
MYSVKTFKVSKAGSLGSVFGGKSAHKRWKEQKVLKEVETMWINVVKQLYDNIKLNGKFRKRFMHQEEIDEWVSFMNEHEILESFADSMAEIEFE